VVTVSDDARRFPRTKRWVKGYDPSQVDRFLTVAELALAGGRDSVTAADIRRVGFDLVPGGYDVTAVDERLDELEARAVEVEQVFGGHALGLDDESLQRPLGLRAGARFPRTGPLRRGYDPGEVDAFLARVGAVLDGSASPGERLSVEDVRCVVFRGRRGGYDEDAVDDYLDTVVDLLLRSQARRSSQEPARH
jgi:DivIVA domain-containing protein